MTNHGQGLKDAADLRQKAETLARERAARMSDDGAALSPEEVRKTLHELRVHQIELEMQNEELRAVQAEVEAGRARYFDLYDLAPVGYCTLSGPGLILEANLTAATLLGMARGALIKQPISRFIFKDDQDLYYLHRHKLFATDEAQELELRLIKPDGARFWAHLTAAPAQAEDGAPVCRLILSDISARKLAEEENEKLQAQLTQAQTIESVARLAGGVAHDFNNMLGVILGYTELALGRVEPREPLHVDLEEIRKAALRSADLMSQLLAFARKQTIAPQVLDLNDTVESMLRMLQRLIGENIDLAWLPDSQLWPVNMDASQLEQILTNLCLNARDAIDGAGRITIETHPATLDATFCAGQPEAVPGDYLLLMVSDNGCGMDKEIAPKIFEPFFTTKEMGKGTGLGLSTVYGIVKQNNGFIQVSSEPGKGTTFKIYLPRHVGLADEISAKIEAETPAGHGETVLLVEDEPAIRRMGGQILEKLGYQALTAGTPGEAVQIARQHKGKIRLLITDVVMPEMNGRDLADQLQALCPDIKSLFISGFTAEVISSCGVLEAGVHFLRKPFSMRDLGAKVREVLDEE